MKSENAGKGLVACEEALQRLLDGTPVVSQHVRLDLSKLTASIVSFEAGFDRGYLKKNRKQHFAILAKIDACRSAANKKCSSFNSKTQISLEEKLARSEKDLATVHVQLDQVLTQNLQLWARVRELELVERQNKDLRGRQKK